jgi:hypothetical protein
MNVKRTELLSLYRQIIKNAKQFPSKNRLRILKEIRLEFRENKNLTDPIKINVEISKAQKGLEQLLVYTNLPNTDSWVVSLEQNPMPRKDS